MDVLTALAARGAQITIYDPVVGTDRIEALGYQAVSAVDRSQLDIAIVLTDHDAIDLDQVASAVPRVFDTRGAYHRRGIMSDHITTL